MTELNAIVQTSAALQRTASRLEKASLLADCLRRLSPAELPAGAAYLAGQLPQGKLGVGRAAIGAARATPPVATPSLSVADVEHTCLALAQASGTGSQARRQDLLAGLFSRATADEQEFLSRLLFGELRQGASGGVFLDAVARAADLPLAELRRAHMLGGDLGAVAVAALSGGRDALAAFSLQLFRPILPMLAQPASDVDAALQEIGEAELELKLDGARVQLHKDGDEVRVYSRRLNDVSAAVPELIEAARLLPARRLILDGETLAQFPDGAPQPFQTTMRRFGRRLDVETLRQTLPLSVYYFDCLRVDDDVLLERPTRQRLSALAAIVPPQQRLPSLITADAAAADAFWTQAIAQGHEGIMAKSLSAPYEAGARGGAWLKLKPVHTLDLVILAVEWGSGRRQGWLSNLHLGARDPNSGAFIMLGKTFKGLTDEMLRWQTEQLLALETERDAWTVYVRPSLVAEIAIGGVQESPHYPGGLALRFARVKRYRPDKSPAEADTIERVRQIFAAERRA